MRAPRAGLPSVASVSAVPGRSPRSRDGADLGADPESLKERLTESLHHPIRELRQPPYARALQPIRVFLRRAADRLYGRDIDTLKPEVDLQHFDPDRLAYFPSGWHYLRRALHHREVGPADVFIELGAGKGRVLCQAARYPFRRVIGVDISPQLIDIARENIERRRDRLRCQDVELVVADLATFDIPDEVTVAYLYHPVAGAPFQAMVDRMLASLDRAPRRLRVIYACPSLGQALVDTGRFRLIKRSRGDLRDRMHSRVCVYEHDPRVSGRPPSQDRPVIG